MISGSNKYDKILEGIEKKLDKIICALNETKAELNRQHHDLYGNGTKGLFKEFNELVDDVEGLKKQVSKNSRFIWGAGLIASFAVSLPVVKEFLKGVIGH